MAVSVPGYATGVVFVYVYNDLTQTWDMRGSAIPVPGTDQPGLCLSPDGNAIAVATVSNVRVFQYQPANIDIMESQSSWVPVGKSFAHGDEKESRQVLACSADLRTISLLRSTLDQGVATLSVFRAVI